MIKNIFIVKGLIGFCTLMACIFSVTALNSVFSIIGLIFTFIFAASYLLFTGIEFIGISYIIIYVGAIAILFLFVILMINIEIKDVSLNSHQLYNNLPLGIIIFFITAYMFYSLLPVFFNNLFLNYNNLLLNENTNNNIELITHINQIESLGTYLYTYQGILLILLGFILLLSMIAAIVLSIKR